MRLIMTAKATLLGSNTSMVVMMKLRTKMLNSEPLWPTPKRVREACDEIRSLNGQSEF